jgi:hypothetical protein
MLIWKGFGILVGVVGVVGLVAGLIAGTVVGAGFGLCLGLGMALAALANWGLWKLIYPKQAQFRQDPATGQQVVHRPNHSFFFIPGPIWTWIFAALAIPLGAFGAFAEKSGKEEAAKPGHAGFTAADNRIGYSKAGDLAHGNTKEAEAAAKAFGDAMKGIGKMAFSGGKNPDAGFPTFCQQGKDSIVFLCHVPELRHYKSDEAKDGLATIAWTCARAAAETLDPAKTKPLVVGLRGITSYGIILQGSPADETPRRAGFSEKSALFYPAFAPGPDPAAGPGS